MSLDFLAITSNGVYVTPVITAGERAARAVSQGLLDALSEPPEPPEGGQSGGLNDVGTATTL